MRKSVASVAMGLTVFFVSGWVQADQAAWIAKKDADAGASLIVVGHELRDYCAPCGDKGYTPRAVTNVAVGQPNPGYWEVRVNGRGVDLAYEYVLQNGHWKNVALALGLRVVSVPAELPASLPRN
ncbi:MAG TPA: hypothetical protein VGH28_26350 [Polyangiaceae bacterium]|jgi:hypothetical protein